MMKYKNWLKVNFRLYFRIFFLDEQDIHVYKKKKLNTDECAQIIKDDKRSCKYEVRGERETLQ